MVVATRNRSADTWEHKVNTKYHTHCQISAGSTVKDLYFAVFPMNVSSLEFNFAYSELLHCYNALPKCLRGIQFHRNSSFVNFAK